MILSSMFKKFLVAALLSSIFLIGAVKPSTVSAQAEWWAPTFQQFNDKVNNTAIPDNEIFGERYTHAQVWWVIYSLINFAIEHDISECATQHPALDDFVGCVTTADASSPDTALSPRKSLGFLEFARLSDLMITTRPVSGVSYVAGIMDNIGIQPAYAQQAGFGFGSLAPILKLWAASRNAAYALMALAVILLAFMVMFRARISPQVSVSVTSAIPRVIIGFILITFSYAIAGFVIDMSYVIQGVIAAVVSQSGVSSLDPVAIFNLINDIGGGLLNFGLAVVWIVLKSGFGGFPVVGWVLGIVAGILVLVVMLLLIILAIIRIFWIFLRTYVMIILHVIALPFAALGYVASPSGNMFTQMLRSLVGHASIFVTISVAVMFAHILLFGMGGGSGGLLENTVAGNPYGVEPLVNSGQISFPGFSGIDVTLLAIFIGSTLLLMAPGLANNIKSLIISGQMSRERSGMIGAGLAGMAIGAAAGGAKSGIGYGLALRGAGMQSGEGWLRNAVGRTLLSTGEGMGAQVLRESSTGVVKAIGRRGDRTPKTL